MKRVKRKLTPVMAMVMVLVMVMGSTTFAADTGYPSIEYITIDEVGMNDPHEIVAGSDLGGVVHEEAVYEEAVYELETTYPISGQENGCDQELAYQVVDQEYVNDQGTADSVTDCEDICDQEVIYQDLVDDYDELENVYQGDTEPFGITPLVSVNIMMSTDVDLLGEIEPLDEITVTVSWTSVLVTSNPVAISVSNGAEILVNYETDVEFLAGGILGAVSDLVTGVNEVTFVSGAVASGNLANEITFRVQAPPAAGDFDLSVLIGLPTVAISPGINFVERTFDVGTGFFVETSYDTIVGDMPFDVFGETGRTNVGGHEYIVAFTVSHIDDLSNPVIEGAYFTAPNGSFIFEQVEFPSYALEGIYVVQAVLTDTNGSILRNADHKYIEYVRPVPTITLNVSSNPIVGSEPFELYGEIDYADVFMLIVEIIYTDSGVLMHTIGPEFDVVSDGNFAFPSWAFPANFPAGRYTIVVTAYSGDFANFTDIATAEIEIEHVKYLLNPTNPRDGTNIAYRGTGAVMDASSTFNNSFNRMPWRANDGVYTPASLGESWQADGPQDMAQWLKVDFGEVREFNRVVIFQNGNRIRDYELEYSVDGVTWYPLSSGFIPALLPGPIPQVFIYDYTHTERVAGKYVRLNMGLSVAANGMPVSIIEFKVYNMPSFYTVTISGIEVTYDVVIRSPFEEQHPFASSHMVPAPEMPGFSVVGVTINGQPASLTPDNYVAITISGDVDLVFQYRIMRLVVIRTVNVNTGEQISWNLLSYVEGSSIQLTAPTFDNYRLTGVLINGQPANLVSGNRVNVNVRGHIEVVFEYTPYHTVTLRHINVDTGVPLLVNDRVYQRFGWTWFSTNQPMSPLPHRNDYFVVGVTVNGQRYTLQGSGLNHVHVNITRDTTIIWEYSRTRTNSPNAPSTPMEIRNVRLSGTATWAGNPNAIARNSNRSLTVRGWATSNGFSLPNTELVVGAYNPRAPLSGTNRRESGVVRTDSAGNFTATFTPSVTSTSQDGDFGYIYIRPANSSAWIWSQRVQFQFFVF